MRRRPELLIPDIFFSAYLLQTNDRPRIQNPVQRNTKLNLSIGMTWLCTVMLDEIDLQAGKASPEELTASDHLSCLSGSRRPTQGRQPWPRNVQYLP